MFVFRKLSGAVKMWTEENASSLAPSGETPFPQNHLLQTLPRHEFERLYPLFERVPLNPRRVLQHAGVPIEHLYFIEDGLISVLASADEKSTVEVWLIGREGLVGSAALLGVRSSPLRHFVQIGGTALRIAVDDLNSAMADMPALRAVLNGYLHGAFVQSAQSAACGLSHSLAQRLARWLLMAQDRSERDELPITQDLLARSLGVRRATVSEAFKPLVHAGVFARERGLIKILDRSRLEEIACRCYRLMRPRRNTAEQPGNGRGRFYALAAFFALIEIELLAQ
jgi:CRP-like cAMP-binding protein